MNVEDGGGGGGFDTPARRPRAGHAPDTLVHNIVIAMLMLTVLIGIAAVHIIVSLQELRDPPAYPGAALVYASEMAFSSTGRIEFAPPRVAEWTDGAAVLDGGAHNHIDASLVVGHRCHCCAEEPALACWLAPCALRALTLELDSDAALAGAPTNATARSVKCYALVAHRESHAASPSWYSAAAAALARERHG